MLALAASRLLGVAGADHAVRTGELGHEQAESALIANEAPENVIGDTGHGRQDGGGTDGDVTYAVPGWEVE
jgi:hypothetical protein